MHDSRLTDPQGNRIDYSCGNKKFQTNISKGKPHGIAPTLGSVLGAPLVVNQFKQSLWLEHVVETKNPTKEYYWLMWYDDNRLPTLPMSGVFEKSDLENMLKGLANFVP
jgi:hypothetical protein